MDESNPIELEIKKGVQEQIDDIIKEYLSHLSDSIAQEPKGFVLIKASKRTTPQGKVISLDFSVEGFSEELSAKILESLPNETD